MFDVAPHRRSCHDQARAYRFHQPVESSAARRSGLSEGDRAGDVAGDARSGDDRRARRGEGRAERGAPRLPLGLLSAHARHPRRQAGAARAAGPRRPLLDRALRPLPALGAGARREPRGDVRPGRLDAEGEGDHRRALWPRLLGVFDFRDQQEPRRAPRGLRYAPAGGGLPLSHPRCPP